METTIQLHQKIVLRIIREQELVIGPLAWDEAKKVEGISVTDHIDAQITAEGSASKTVIDHLVDQYKKIFGKASEEVCKEAVRDLVAELPADDVPSSLK